MLKNQELLDPRSCLNKAHPDEPLFVLLGRDVAAPATIRAWIVNRIRLDKNKIEDTQIQDALVLANRIEADLKRAGKL